MTLLMALPASAECALLLSLCMLAALSDIQSGKIGNLLTFSGAALGLAAAVRRATLAGTPLPVLLAAAGFLIPILLGLPLFIFRMIGAGDLKLLAACGAVIGARDLIPFLLVCLVCGAVISLILMLTVTGVRERLRYFATYLRGVLTTGAAPPYRDDPSAEFHFAVPVLMAAVLYAAGLIG